MRNITADLYNERGPRDRFASFCVGAGRANEALRRDFYEHLKTAVEHCGFRYLRFHGLFHDDMAVYREAPDGRPIYNWQYIDAVFDMMLSLGIRPFVELSFTPRAMASGEKTIFWWRGNVTPPADLDKWARWSRHLHSTALNATAMTRSLCGFSRSGTSRTTLLSLRETFTIISAFTTRPHVL